MHTVLGLEEGTCMLKIVQYPPCNFKNNTIIKFMTGKLDAGVLQEWILK